MSKIENINDKTMAINSKYMLSKKVKAFENLQNIRYNR